MITLALPVDGAPLLRSYGSDGNHGSYENHEEAADAADAAGLHRSSGLRGNVLHSVFSLARTLERDNWRYTSEFYWRGELRLKRRTPAVWGIANRRYWWHKGRELWTEQKGQSEFTGPGVFTRKVTQTWGLRPDDQVDQWFLTDFNNVTPYGLFLLGTKVLSPLNGRNAAYYRYRLVDSTARRDTVRISFRRRVKNMQLVSGHFDYCRSEERVVSMRFEGMYDFVSFDEQVTMGSMSAASPYERYWPVICEVKIKYWFWWAKFEGSAVYRQQFTAISKEYAGKRQPVDQTHVYRLEADRTPAVVAPIGEDDGSDENNGSDGSDGSDGNNENDGSDGRDGNNGNDGSDVNHVNHDGRRRSREVLKYIGEFMFHDHDLVNTQGTRLSMDAPELGWTPSRGVTLRQDLSLERQLGGGRRMGVWASASYYFGNKEFKARLNHELLLMPRSAGKAGMEMGMRYESAMMSRLMPNGLRVFDLPDGTSPLELNARFRDYYLNIFGQREVTNGLYLRGGIMMHSRKPRPTAPLGYGRWMNGLESHDGELQVYRLEHFFKRRYQDFALQASVSYTPHRPYVRLASGEKRVLDSRWPTFSLNVERGLKNVLGSTNGYEMWEAEVSQIVSITRATRLMWKGGGGMFTSRADNEFVLWQRFNAGVEARDWDDDFSGCFQLLPQQYYNTSYHYLRGHVVLDTPVLLVNWLSTRLLRSERLYMNVLGTEGLTPYVELGYGVSDCVCDVSVFSSWLRREGWKTGFKFSLHF